MEEKNLDVSIQDLIDQHDSKFPKEKLLTDKHKAVIVIRKFQEEENVGFNILGGGSFRENDAVMIIVSMLELLDYNITKPSRPEHFAVLKKLLKELGRTYIDLVKMLDAKLKEMEEKDLESKQGGKTDA